MHVRLCDWRGENPGLSLAVPGHAGAQAHVLPLHQKNGRTKRSWYMQVGLRVGPSVVWKPAFDTRRERSFQLQWPHSTRGPTDDEARVQCEVQHGTIATKTLIVIRHLQAHTTVRPRPLARARGCA